MELNVWVHGGVPPGKRPVEVVERKGLGHPDTICDAIAEHVEACLARHYLARFGQVLHHNVDKVLLCGGAARPALGGGEVLAPIEIILAGRATTRCGGVEIPVHELAVEACRAWLRTHLRALDVDRDVRIRPRLAPGSLDLVGLFESANQVIPANDTSVGAGFAPPTELERIVLAVERRLNDPATKADHPALGEDVKVMGVRRDRRVTLTIGCAIVDRHVADVEGYLAAVATARRLALAAARATSALEVDAIVNAADDPAAGRLFLTCSGTSAEAGDDGEVGRGNRVGGLITPCRPMTMEAAAGKNGVSHVGKLYNILAARIAAGVAGACPEVEDVGCLMVSRIGRPIDDPALVDLAVSSPVAASASIAREVVHTELGTLAQLQQDLLAERVPVY